MSALEQRSAWQRFWDQGGWWRALLLVVVYMALYLGAGWVGGQLFGGLIRPAMFSTAGSVFAAVTFPLIVGALLLLGFAASLGWLGALFGPQPVRGRWWMWVAPALIVLSEVLRYLGIDYAGYPVVMILVTGLLVGLVEELVARGLVIMLLRRAGMAEWGVMLLSSAIFGLMHSTNVLNGQPVLTVAITVVFAFTFGVLMYLTLRVTGRLIWPILLHGLYDPTLFLISGGIDVVGTGPQSALVNLAGSANLWFMVAAVVLVPAVIISDRWHARRSPLEPSVVR